MKQILSLKFKKLLQIECIPALQVFPVETRLTVYHRLLYTGQSSVDGAVTHTVGAEILKKLSFSRTSIHFLDFSSLFIGIAEAHARGFAPL